jgi:HEAT repeat protein
LEALAQGLLVGDDALRRACAEALARNAEEGHPVLQEALQHENIDVRRAAVFGIACIDAPWVVETLTRIQHTEVQWIVRSAAQDTLARLKDAEARAPRTYQPIEAQGWLVAWAAQNGLGVPSGQGALEVLRRALREGDELTQMAAADAYGRLGDPALTPDLYGLLHAPNAMLAQAAYRALAAIAAAAAVQLAAPVSPN